MSVCCEPRNHRPPMKRSAHGTWSAGAAALAVVCLLTVSLYGAQGADDM